MANIDYDGFKGKLGVGRVHSGSLKKGQTVAFGRPQMDLKTSKIAELFVFDNLGRAVSLVAAINMAFVMFYSTCVPLEGWPFS